MKKTLILSIGFLVNLSTFAGDATNCLDIRKNQYGGQELFNKCGYPVEATWCYYSNSHNCTKFDNQLTLGANRSYDLIANRQVLYGGCAGTDSIERKRGTNFWCK